MAPRSKAAGTHLRAIPAQKRSADTVERILAASLDILDSQGLQAFNTNAVATAAGVNVGTVYHYFPDKNSILRELFERHESRRAEWVAGRLEELATTTDVRAWVEDILKGIVRMRRSTPGTRVLRSAIRVVPELQQVEDALDARSVAVLSDVIGRRCAGLSAKRAVAVARTIVETTTVVLDRAGEHEPSQGEALRELAELISAYIGSLPTR